jgi:hypothetical protein
MVETTIRAIKFRDKKLTVGLLFKSQYGSVSYNGFTNLLGKRNEKVIRSCDSGRWRSRKTYEPDMDFIIPVIRWDCLSYPKTILKKDDIIVLSEDEAPFKFMTYLKDPKPSGPSIFKSIIMFCPVEKKFAMLHRHKAYQMNNGSLICPSYSIKYISDCEFNENMFENRNFSQLYHKVPVIKEKTSLFEYKKTTYFASETEIKLLKNRYYKKGYSLSIDALDESRVSLYLNRVSLYLNQKKQLKSLKDLESEVLNDYKEYEQKTTERNRRNGKKET